MRSGACKSFWYQNCEFLTLYCIRYFIGESSLTHPFVFVAYPLSDTYFNEYYGVTNYTSGQIPVIRDWIPFSSPQLEPTFLSLPLNLLSLDSLDLFPFWVPTFLSRPAICMREVHLIMDVNLDVCYHPITLRRRYTRISLVTGLVK